MISDKLIISVIWYDMMSDMISLQRCDAVLLFASLREESAAGNHWFCFLLLFLRWISTAWETTRVRIVQMEQRSQNNRSRRGSENQMWGGGYKPQVSGWPPLIFRWKRKNSILIYITSFFRKRDPKSLLKYVIIGFFEVWKRLPLGQLTKHHSAYS